VARTIDEGTTVDADDVRRQDPRPTPPGARRTLVVAVATLALLAASCSSDDGDQADDTDPTVETTTSVDPATTSAPIDDHGTLGVADTDLGEVLTDDLGYTLYVFDDDVGQDAPTCFDECADKWPPYIVSEVDAPGLDVDLGTVDRGDGFRQLTINGRPAYTMAEETGPGQTLCQGGDGVWWVVGIDGEAITDTDDTDRTTTPDV
jgi:predicted lipoprotein with Yx(FWY)xxD motif